MSFALVENIPTFDIITKTGSKFKPELRAATTVCILLSIFGFGGLTRGVLERAGVAESGREGGGGGGEEGGGEGDGNDIGMHDVLLRRRTTGEESTAGHAGHALDMDVDDSYFAGGSDLSAGLLADSARGRHQEGEEKEEKEEPDERTVGGIQEENYGDAEDTCGREGEREGEGGGEGSRSRSRSRSGSTSIA